MLHSCAACQTRDRARFTKLWVLNSGTGHLGTVDLANGDFTPRAFCQGFLRGLAFHNHHAVVGLSLSRDGSFSGLALDDEMKKPGVRRPMAASFTGPEINEPLTFEA
jgi:hypothetical protein